jgi:hypothetical protein
MRCQHCENALTEEEQATNAQTAAIHGLDLGLCRLCWDAWGTMACGWQAGVPEDQRVRFVDRAVAWDARRPT